MKGPTPGTPDEDISQDSPVRLSVNSTVVRGVGRAMEREKTAEGERRREQNQRKGYKGRGENPYIR